MNSLRTARAGLTRQPGRRRHLLIGASLAAALLLTGGAALFGRAHSSSSLLGLHDPSALATDRRGNVFVADTGNHRVLELSPDGTQLAIRKRLPSIATGLSMWSAKRVISSATARAPACTNTQPRVDIWARCPLIVSRQDTSSLS